jgi:hypothetical protein
MTIDARGQATSLTGWYIGDPQPALLPYPVQALTEAVAPEGGCLAGSEGAARAHRKTVATALQHMSNSWPVLAGAIKGVVRHIVLFDDIARNSFATPAAHGVAFVNVALGTSEPFFVEDLAHQCGHVLFTAAWEGGEPLLTVPANTAVGELTDRDDHRTLEVLLHGMFTQTLMVGALDRLLLSNTEIDRYEGAGRLAFALVRLGLDLRMFATLPVYSDAGIALLRELIAAYMSAAERHRHLLMTADLADQPYNFDYVCYKARNRASHSATTT